MQRFIEYLAREPAMAVAVVLAVANLIVELNAEQALQVGVIVESIILLVAGGVVRQSVYSPATVDDIREGLKP